MTAEFKTPAAHPHKVVPYRRKSVLATFRSNWGLLCLCLPALACYILFQYIPMGGLVLAFKKYHYNMGLFGSPWAGLDNFKYLFESSVLLRIVRNTVGYNVAFIIIGVVSNVAFALLLYEINNKKALKAYQTIITFPNFLSWVMVGYITYGLFNPSYGLVNQMAALFGVKGTDIYTSTGVWPFILVFVERWKNIGMGCIIYYASLVGIDPNLYEAAQIDGANRWRQTIHISIPSLTPLITIMVIMASGQIFAGDFGLFYQIPRNVGVLYEAIDIVETYVYRGLKQADFGMSSAVGLVQSFIGLGLVLATNQIVKRISPENSMF